MVQLLPPLPGFKQAILMCLFPHLINIYYCTTGRAIRGNIQFEAGSIGPSAARDNTEAEN